MAEEVALAGTGSRAKLRNPLGVVGLSIITIGIYYFFWWYFIKPGDARSRPGPQHRPRPEPR
jgi:hypothetical protein